MTPVFILPVRNLAILAQRIGPVVPRLAAQRPIRIAVLGRLDGAQFGHRFVLEIIDSLLPKHRVVNVAGHNASLVRGVS